MPTLHFHTQSFTTLSTHIHKPSTYSLFLNTHTCPHATACEPTHHHCLGIWQTRWCEPQSTRFETQQKYWNTCPRKTKIQIFDRNPDPTFIIKTWTKGISVTPWPNDYNWITNQMYKVWMPQRRISDKFTVLKNQKKSKASYFFFWFLFNNLLYYNECMLFIRHDWK